MKANNVVTYVVILFACGCTKSPSNSTPAPTPAVPAVTVSGIQQQRPPVSTAFHFYFTLSQPATKNITINYNTVDGTAKAGKDFTATSGMLTIPAGSQQGTVDVLVTGDSLRQDDLVFTLQLSAPQNCTLTNSVATATIINNNNLYLPTDNTGYSTPAVYPGKTLVWSDEFNGSGVDGSNWNFESGGGGWGNQELENYTARPENVFVSNGNLIIESRRENFGTSSYTSARMNTKGKREFQFGRVDIRAKLPVGNGIWPALWMLGTNISTVGWPACGETDIMELIGKYPSRVYGTLHYANTSGQHVQSGNNYNLAGEDFSQKFHVFSLIWQPDAIQMLVDDQVYFSFANTSGNYPFNAPFYFIFNVAVGGQFPGNPDASTPFPERMFVDYIRVFK